MEIVFNILAVALLGAAVYFYSAGDADWLFASVVLGVCSFFLGVRFRIKKRMNERQATEIAADADDD
jgi:hypothetical protein